MPNDPPEYKRNQATKYKYSTLYCTFHPYLATRYNKVLDTLKVHINTIVFSIWAINWITDTVPISLHLTVLGPSKNGNIHTLT